MTPPAPPAPLLDWQHARRRQGVPTVSVLAGPVGLGVKAWRAWAAGRGAAVAATPARDPAELVGPWVAAAFAELDPADAAIQWLAAVTAEPPAAVSAAVGRMTRYDFDRWRPSLPVDPADPPAVAAHFVLARHVSGTPTGPGELTRALLEPTPGGPSSHAGAIRAVCGMIPEDRWPALVAVEPAGAADPGEWFAGVLRLIEPVAAAVPLLPVAVAVTQAAYDRAEAAHPAARPQAMAREGYVAVRGVSAADLAGRLRGAGVDPPPAADTLHQLAADGLAEETAEAYVRAARVARDYTPETDAEARSAAERFLFERLEAHPETGGLFSLNRPLPFAHGTRAAEADLLAGRLKLVVEVDGRYYHLKPEQYRRDRRKDWLYQRHGYLTLRFLAEDVVADPGPVLDAILEAVAYRRAHPTPERGDRT